MPEIISSVLSSCAADADRDVLGKLVKLWANRLVFSSATQTSIEAVVFPGEVSEASVVRPGSRCVCVCTVYVHLCLFMCVWVCARLCVCVCLLCTMHTFLYASLCVCM